MARTEIVKTAGKIAAVYLGFVFGMGCFFLLMRSTLVIPAIIIGYSLPFLAGVVARQPFEFPVWAALMIGGSFPLLQVAFFMVIYPGYHPHKVVMGVIFHSLGALTGWILAQEFLKRRTA